MSRLAHSHSYWKQSTNLPTDKKRLQQWTQKLECNHMCEYTSNVCVSQGQPFNYCTLSIWWSVNHLVEVCTGAIYLQILSDRRWFQLWFITISGRAKRQISIITHNWSKCLWPKFGKHSVANLKLSPLACYGNHDKISAEIAGSTQSNQYLVSTNWNVITVIC